MALTTRPLTRDDFDQSMALSREAFGHLPPNHEWYSRVTTRATRWPSSKVPKAW